MTRFCAGAAAGNVSGSSASATSEERRGAASDDLLALGRRLEILDRPPETLRRSRPAANSPSAASPSTMSASVCGTSPARDGVWRRSSRRPRSASSRAMISSRLMRSPQPTLNTSPARRRRLAGEQVGLHDVVDVGEVARLRAVAVHLERLPAQPPLDEARDDRRVLRLRVLTRAEDVEVAQPTVSTP